MNRTDAPATSSEPQKTVRAGVFSKLPAADRAVSRLLGSGFSHDEITVICSDEAREKHFKEFEHQKPAGEYAGVGTATGATVGAMAGGLTAIAVGAVTGAVPLIIAGATGIAAGSAIGGFAGAMVPRGLEKEASNFYDQEVRKGQILVAVEVHGAAAEKRLSEAARILEAEGATTAPLPEG